MAIGGLLANLFGQGAAGTPLPSPANVRAQPPGSAGFFGGMGDTLGRMRQDHPEALIALGAGIAAGNMPGGFEAAGQAMQVNNRDRRAEALQERGWARDDARFAQTFGLQQQEFGLRRQALAQEQGQRAAVNSATASWLESVGAPAEIVTLARSGAGMDAMKLYQSMSGAGETVGMQPGWFRDEAGNMVPGQYSSNAQVRLSEIPEGYTAVPPAELNASRAYGTAVGRAEGEAMAGLPAGLMTANSTVRQIDEVINHPGLASVLGPLDSRSPDWMVGQAGVDARARLDQLQGKAFLEAYGMLRGGGAITEIEGAKAEAAMTRMNRAQGVAEFQAALRDFRDAVVSGQQKLLMQAGVPQEQWGQVLSTIPGAGSGGTETVIDGVRIRRVN